ncbi:hypothetical protein ACNKHV_07995 [Shigella flexneri]
MVLASNTSTKRAGSNGINQFSTRLRLPFRIGLIRVYTSCSVGIGTLPNMVRTARLLFVTPTQQCKTAGEEGGLIQFCVFTQK